VEFCLEEALFKHRNFAHYPDEVLFNLSGKPTALSLWYETTDLQPILAEGQNCFLNWYGKVRLVLALLFPSPAYMRWRYRLKKSWALPVYYPFRWWGIAKDAAYTLIELLKRQFVPRT
jgi:hypothetical protein